MDAGLFQVYDLRARRQKITPLPSDERAWREVSGIQFGESVMHKNTLIAFVVSTLMAMPIAGFAAGSADQEITTATTHAQMAADAADAATAVMHFHHVINCLVGPKSKLFDAAVGNPCNGMGNGALRDVPQKSATHAELSRALAVLEQALHAQNLAATQKYSAHVSEILKSIKLGG